MIDPALIERLLHYTFFTLTCALILFIRILPVNTGPGVIPGPELIACLIFAWSQRRPDTLPPLLMGTALILADLILMRPPGLWAVLVLIGAEFLRSRHHSGTDLPFAAEWGFVAVTIVVISLIQTIVLSILAPNSLSVELVMVQALMTVTAYPVMVGFCHTILKIRRIQLTESSKRGIGR